LGSLKGLNNLMQMNPDPSVQSGLADFLGVLDAERSLYAAQDALVQSDQTVSLDLVQLYKALGGGWQNETGPAPSMAQAAR
jgi:outer membrane protein TolC